MKKCRVLSVVLILLAAVPLAASHTESEVLKGTKFMAVVNGNTISGKTKDGAAWQATRVGEVELLGHVAGGFK